MQQVYSSTQCVVHPLYLDSRTPSSLGYYPAFADRWGQDIGDTPCSAHTHFNPGQLIIIEYVMPRPDFHSSTTLCSLSLPRLTPREAAHIFGEILGLFAEADIPCTKFVGEYSGSAKSNDLMDNVYSSEQCAECKRIGMSCTRGCLWSCLSRIRMI